jgi:pimeloyl-ACP methyl ester carboxylesterase
MTNVLWIVGILALARLAYTQLMQPDAATLVTRLGHGFESKFARVNGTQFHYVRGGNGPAVILLPGFPEDWYEFRLIMPRLAKAFTVVALDLRGVGESAPSDTGYEAANLAEDVHELIVNLRLEHVYIFGHDIGGIVVYAFARRYPGSVRGVMVLDAAFPGLDPWQDILGHPAFWHVRFHQTSLPEKLVSGRQAEYLRYFLGQISDAEVSHYSQSYRDPDHLRAAFEPYRAFAADEKFFAAQRGQTELPIVIGSGEHDAFAKFLPQIADGMRAHGCANLKAEMVHGAGHYVAEEKPAAVAELIERYAGWTSPARL